MRLLVIFSILTGGLLVPWMLFHLLESSRSYALSHLHRQIPHSRQGTRLNDSVVIPKEPGFHPPLRTSGARIVDKFNQTVRLYSINWYGASDINLVVSGLDLRHRNDISRLIRLMGFNSVRLPYADELLYANPVVAAEDIAANPDLFNHTALEVYHAVVHSLTDAGIMVIPNNHITQATWCCGANLCDASWANDWLGPICRVKQTEDMWIQNWERIMLPLRDNPLVIGADLRNEVRGPWGTMKWATWATAAERAAEALLHINPQWLMFVEGVSSANDLAGVADRPVTLSVKDRVVYEAHVYCWSGWGALSPYSRRTYKSFVKDMRKNWAYLIEQDVAPVWIGEFGTADWPDQGDLHYWQNLMDFMDDVEPSWGYWAINPRKPAGNSWESYGLVEDDWETGMYSVPDNHHQTDIHFSTMGLSS